jgi:general secretion pathway protein D
LTGPRVCRAAEEKKVQINFAGLDLATLAKQVEKVTKKTFLFDESQLKNIRVTLQSESQITPAEFYRVFQTVCQMHDLALIPVEDAGLELEKIVKAQAAFKEPGVHPVLVRGDDLPRNDRLVSYLVKLKHAAPAKITAALSSALSSTGSVVQVANTDMIFVNDVASSIKRVEKLLTLLDIPGEPVVTQSIPVRNLGVDKAQSLLAEYLQALGKTSGVEGFKDRIVMMKDERLNILHLIGAEREIQQAGAFLKIVDVDSPSSQRAIRYYKLNNVPVKDIVDYVSQLLGLALEAPATEAAPGDPARQPLTQTPSPGAQPNQPGPGLPPLNAPPGAPLADAGSGGPRSKPGKRRSASVDSIEIIPVEGLNTLVVAGDARVHQEVAEILKNLDKRKGQVLIEVAIVQVTGNDSLDLGVELLKIHNAANTQVDGGTGAGIGKQGDPGENGVKRGFPTESVLPGFAGTAFRFTRDNNLQVLLTALAGKSNVSIVSQPVLLVNDNQAASFTTKVSEPTTTTSQGTATTNTSFNGFADATTALKITPHISPDGYLNLEINQTFEEFSGPAPGAGIPPPKVSNNADTKVTIPDRQTIVIGGFTRDAASATRSGVPGLMNIPGLGKLFSRETKSKTVSRLYLFVRPKILSTENFSDLSQESDLKKEDLKDLSKKSSLKREIQSRMEEPKRAEVIDLDDPSSSFKKPSKSGGTGGE